MSAKLMQLASDINHLQTASFAETRLRWAPLGGKKKTKAIFCQQAFY
jgi:hypothetical protein